ncbi:MAG: flagellar basal-body rod protein FlgF [Rhizomicrobium sp.]|jgi:flagellar basal-body rod protein FlgF
MDNTLLVSVSQQLVAYDSIDTIANNLANISTPGFKRDSTLFEEYLSQAKPSEDEKGTQQISFVWNAGTARDLSGGRIETTNNPLDLAINGKGYFVVQTANGPRYTRDGHFTLDATGRLVTEDGDPVQGDGGNLTITPQDGNIYVASDGTITGGGTTPNSATQLGKLQLVQFDDETQLSKEGSTLYSTSQPTQPATSASIKQGMIESSNVEPVKEMSKMIEIMRAYQAVANIMQSHDNLKRSAVDKLASTQSS